MATTRQMIPKRKPRATKKEIVYEPIPDTPIPAIESIEEATICVYGRRGIGKTSVCAESKDPVFLMCESGGRGLNIRRVQIKSWAAFKHYVTQLESGKVKCSTVVVDTADKAYDYCSKAVCGALGISHPSDLGYGKGWDAVSQEFAGLLRRLMQLEKIGVMLVCHDTTQEIETALGTKWQMIVPQLSKGGTKVVLAEADVIGYYHYGGPEGQTRLLRIRGNAIVEAKQRIKEKFWAKDGSQVQIVPMGESETEAYQNLVRAFNNEQPDDGTEKEEPRTTRKKRPALKPPVVTNTTTKRPTTSTAPSSRNQRSR